MCPLLLHSRKRFFEEEKLLLKKAYDEGMNSVGKDKPQIQQFAKRLSRNEEEIKVTYNLANSSQLRIFFCLVYTGGRKQGAPGAGAPHFSQTFISIPNFKRLKVPRGAL